MAFGSCIGAGGALVQAVSISPPGVYADQINGAPLAAGPFWRKAEVEERSVLNELTIAGDLVGAVLLAARIAVPNYNGTPADAGFLVTAAAGTDIAVVNPSGAGTTLLAANQHGLPANFGPGRGNWVAGDLDKLMIRFDRPSAIAQGAAGETQLPQVDSVQIVAGDVVICIHDRGEQDLTNVAAIVLHYKNLA